jgi:hypothetical protein
MVLLLIIIILTVLEALHEGLHHKGKKTIAGVIEFIKLFGISAMIPYFIWYDGYDYYFDNHWSILVGRFMVPFVLGWITVRYAIFDFVHNAAAGLNLYHIGTTKLYDKLLAWLMNEKIKQPRNIHFWITRTLLLVVGVSLILHI